ncbi:DNA-binding protein [Reyranella sp.]|uniref:DNA-binding protein n=1 Tax=Reyranella sp. TaxID=1929291 RepID=UPI0037838A1A
MTFDDLVSPEKRYSRGSRRGTEQAPRQADVPEISDADLQRLLDEELGQEGRERTPRDVLRDKATAAIVRLVDKASEQAALEALAAPDDVSSLVSFLASSEMARVLATEARDPLAGAIARGTAQRKSLVDAEGGTASAQEIADLLGITRQAVDKRRRKGALLAVPSGSNDWRYPRWQILEGHVLPGFERVMAAFEATGPWTRLHFFLSANERLADQRPLDALRLADIEPVIEAAAALGEHGAS